MKFEREKHVYKSKDFEEIVLDTIRFFNGTPVHKLPPPENFHGTGVYCVYYIGKHVLYKELFEINRTEYSLPIYIGKAVPKGWRQARERKPTKTPPNELFVRLREHAKSIGQTKDLKISDFKCRFIILENEEESLIGTVEAALIKHYKPLWNTAVDGFGNHDPGSGRYDQAKSEWDVTHSGRSWAKKCKGKHSSMSSIEERIALYFSSLGKHYG